MAHKAVSPASPTLRGLLLVLSVGVVYVCWPLWPALVLALWTAGLARPLLARFEHRLNGRRRAAAALSLALFVVLCLPVALLVVGAIVGAQDVAQVVTHALAQPEPAKHVLEAAAVGDGAHAPSVPTSLAEAVDLVQRYGAQVLKVFTNVAGMFASGLIGLLIYFGGAYVFLVDGPQAWAWCRRHAPLAPAQLERLGVAFQETGRGLLVGVGLTSATQGAVATLSYLALGIPRWWVLGPVTALTSLLPVVGTSLVWLPLSLGLFLSGHPVKAAILVLFGVVVIGSVDNLLRPFFARMGALKMPALLLFVAVFGGIVTFGPWGGILGPLVVRLWMEAVALRRDEVDAVS